MTRFAWFAMILAAGFSSFAYIAYTNERYLCACICSWGIGGAMASAVWDIDLARMTRSREDWFRRYEEVCSQLDYDRAMQEYRTRSNAPKKD